MNEEDNGKTSGVREKGVYVVIVCKIMIRDAFGSKRER
jgi:hypothetical protein